MSALNSEVRPPSAASPASADAAMFEFSAEVTLSGNEPNSTPLALPPPTLAAIGERIRARDAEAAACSRQTALENGHDLRTAKDIAGHGHFERWCRENLRYSKSRAEKLMRLAAMLGPVTKSVGPTDLPAIELLIDLSAPSTPADIRDTFVPRIKAGESVDPDLRAALKKNRDDRKRTKLQGQPDAETRPFEAAHEAASDDPDDGGHAAAHAEALSLIKARLGDDLPRLMDLLRAAGPGRIFAPAVERALEEIVWATAEPRMAEASDVEGRSEPGVEVRDSPGETGKAEEARDGEGAAEGHKASEAAIDAPEPKASPANAPLSTNLPTLIPHTIFFKRPRYLSRPVLAKQGKATRRLPGKLEVR